MVVLRLIWRTSVLPRTHRGFLVIGRKWSGRDSNPRIPRRSVELSTWVRLQRPPQELSVFVKGREIAHPHAASVRTRMKTQEAIATTTPIAAATLPIFSARVRYVMSFLTLILYNARGLCQGKSWNIPRPITNHRLGQPFVVVLPRRCIFHGPAG